MDKVKESNKNLMFCMVFAIIAFVFNFIAFCTPYWIVSKSEFKSQFVRLGLWEACFDNYVHPEDYVSKLYTGCWYVYWPEYDYIRDWLNPPWFYGVQMIASLCLLCNGLGMIVTLLKFVNALAMQDKTTNILGMVLQLVAIGGYIVVVVTMGVMSKDREWMPRPDHNRVSWSFAFAVLGGFFTIFSFFHLIIHYFVFTWAPNAKHKGKTQYQGLALAETGGSTIYKSHQSSGFGGHPGGSTVYSQSGIKPTSMVGITSGATASAKVREAMSQKQKNQLHGSMSSLNSVGQMKNRVGSQHSLASLGRQVPPNMNSRGSLSSLHMNNNASRRNDNQDDSVV